MYWYQEGKGRSPTLVTDRLRIYSAILRSSNGKFSINAQLVRVIGTTKLRALFIQRLAGRAISFIMSSAP